MQTECTSTPARKVWIAADADRRIRLLERQEREMVDARLAELRRVPCQAAMQLQGWEDIWSVRAGRWRMYCLLADNVRILAIGQLTPDRWPEHGAGMVPSSDGGMPSGAGGFDSGP